ncbi:Hint domain-containing protein [Lutimaribacter sp. EGI FJ00015]|nr:Hint domain-containing protein [Lutimaribacter sp. EGI FJ00015]
MSLSGDQTLVATARGEMPLERLQAGNMVLTRDNGLRPVRRIRNFPKHAVAHLDAVTIRAGALGDGMPFRDVTLSAAHRVVVTGEIAAMLFDRPEALIAAHRLRGVCGVSLGPARLGVHVEFDQPEVILVNGVWSECFLAAQPSRDPEQQNAAAELAVADLSGAMQDTNLRG